ncbi:MAG: metallophosphatase, partial [Gemmatimonadetes bacterium]|nr:metallophosphatase [Gemmatimonadota bacterium]
MPAGSALAAVLILLQLACASAAQRKPEDAALPRAARKTPPPPCPGVDPANAGVHLTFLATNDFHGALESKTYPWSNGRPVGGAGALAAAIESAREVNPGGTVLLDGGDVMQGTPISNLVRGASVIELFNLLGYDAAAIGNHEFDWGIDTLQARVAQARFPFLSANIVERASERAPSWSPATRLLERKGVRIGVIGLTTRSTPATTLPDNVRQLVFTDLAQAVNRAVPQLQAAGAELIVVLAHAGAVYDADAERYRGEIADAMPAMDAAVDLVVSGHTHTLQNAELNGIVLVQARSSGTALAIVDLWVDPESGEVVCSTVDVPT